MRQNFTMTQADFDEIMAAIERARKTPSIMLQSGMPRSVQEVANDVWAALGKKMGFAEMTVPPNGDNQLMFTAEPTK